ncbi:LuxR C-terminal-related transcriptional regulator [Microbacterium sp. HD4P20]|uniref:helix-turn-helix transcriptional regulator n=1 Tax=Microbacterium sp. HD4P20 TaxID=2864874 RepID=UPI001C63EA4A|nr:LuxR C-terminal-related transcriptional regulator [Microbacterium sp. HD4P20]MCP2635560.1 LuxR C-terminal-related transcriptional regulator [Microbacterium sp. HD4P20]
MPGDVVSRSRLLPLLDNGAPLTVVRGACGAGKTVLLHEWVSKTDGRIAWVAADRDHADSAALARMILRHLRPASSEQPADQGWGAVRDCLAEYGEPVTVVVDDAAMLHRDALVDLCEAVAALPSLRVVAASNRRTVLDSDGVGLRVDRSVVGPVELMFDEDEVCRALGVDGEIAGKILEATNGFPAVIHAMARHTLPGDDAALLHAAVEAVEEYMRIRIARSGYDPTLIATLLRLSFAEELDVSLARDLGGHPHAARFLDEAESYGFGSWNTGGSERLFRFAPFARELLRRELDRRHASELPQLRRTMIAWNVARGAPTEALRAAIESDDLESARRVVMVSWHALLNDGKSVREILSPVPLSALRDEPLLVMLLAVCYNGVRVRRLRGLQLFRIAVAAANSQQPEVGAADRLFIWVAESAALRVLGMPDRAADVAIRAMRLLADTSEEDKEPYAAQVPLLCAQLGISLYYGGHQRQAIECFAFGVAVAAAGDAEQTVSNLSMLSGIHALNGDLPEARHYVEIIREGDWPRGYLDGYHGTFYRVAEAILALEEGDGARAAEHVAAFEPHRATSEHWLTMAAVEALTALRLGQPAMGSARLESLVQVRGREGHSAAARRSLSCVRALLHLAQGRIEAAKAVLHKDAPEDRFETIVERARIALLDDRPRDTMRILSQTRIQPTTSRLRAAAAALRTAAVLRTAGVGAARHEALTLAALLCDREMRMPLALLPPADATAVWQLLRDEAPCAIHPFESVLPPSLSAPPLTERELIVLRALPSGKPLTAIATELGVSPNTVKSQVKSVYRKLGVGGREEAVAEAGARHLLAGHE